MKKFLNDPADFVDEMLAGIVAAHPSLRLDPEDGRVIVRHPDAAAGRVGIVTGGGSGHLPVFLGYVGEGLCSAAAIGNVFSSPSVETVERATKAVDGGAGVLYLYGNYGGDVMNFDESAELLAEDGLETATVLVADDVASAPPEERSRRRGVAGLVFAYKAAGAAAAAGGSLAEVAAAAELAVARTRSMGVGLGPTVLPTSGVPTFEIGEDEMEIGIGIHGERGIERGPLRSADEVGRELARRVCAEAVAGAPLAVMVNSLGATSPEELYVTYGSIAAEIGALGFEIERAYVGRYATSMEMAGLSLTVLSLDQRLRELLRAPARSPFFREDGVELGHG